MVRRVGGSLTRPVVPSAVVRPGWPEVRLPRGSIVQLYTDVVTWTDMDRVESEIDQCNREKSCAQFRRRARVYSIERRCCLKGSMGYITHINNIYSCVEGSMAYIYIYRIYIYNVYIGFGCFDDIFRWLECGSNI